MKLKSFLVLLLSICVIILGALLPKFVGDRQDAANDNQVLFASIKDVQLEFTQEEMTVSQAVALLGKYRESIDIPESLTALKRDKAEAIAISAVQRYYQAGVLFQDPTNQGQILSCSPFLMYGYNTSNRDIAERYDANGSYDANSNGQNNIYWSIAYGNTDGTYVSYIFIDDRTGMVCSIEYSDTKHKYYQGDMEFVLSCFCDLYLTDLGEEFYWCDYEDIVSKASTPFDNSYLASDISWNDTVYGECRITFFVGENCFYTNIQ